MRGDDAAKRLRSLTRSFVQAFGLLDEQRTPCGIPISPRAAHALAVLHAAELEGAGVRQHELGAALGIDKSNVTRLVQRLAADGHVSQAEVEDDARHRTLRLTAKGRRLAERVDAASVARFASVLRGMSAAETERVLDALGVLAEAAQRVVPEDARADA